MACRAAIPVILAFLVAACGSDQQPSVDSGGPTTLTELEPSPADANTLAFRRADGSVIEMPGRAVAWCGPDDALPGNVLQVAAIMDVQRTANDWFSYWHVWAVPRDVARREPISFPLKPSWEGRRGAHIFVGDSVTENEASTGSEDSSGQIVFSQASCELGEPIEFELDAVIDSEFFDGEPVSAQGTFRGVLETAPPGYYE